MPKKRQIVKRANKNNGWHARLDERTQYLKDIVDEIKANILRFEEKIDKKFDNLDACIGTKFEDHRKKVDEKFLALNTNIDQKFAKHNDYHINKEKKYLKWFLILGALVLGSLLANPAGIEQVAAKVMLVIKFLIRFF